MKRALFSLLSLAAAVVLPSCFQNETTIHLNKDGSGTIVEEMKFGTQMMAMMAQLGVLNGGGSDPMKEAFAEERMKERAELYGKGVSLEQVERLQEGGQKGGRITYRFTDINQVRLLPGEAVAGLLPELPMVPKPESPESDPVTFRYAGGTLHVRMPEPKDAKIPDDSREAMEELEANGQMQQMAKQMVGDMKMSFKLVIEPGIARTDAAHVSGNAITLSEVDMGKVVASEDGLKQMMSFETLGASETMERMKNLEGVKLEPKRDISVEVK